VCPGYMETLQHFIQGTGASVDSGSFWKAIELVSLGHRGTLYFFLSAISRAQINSWQPINLYWTNARGNTRTHKSSFKHRHRVTLSPANNLTTEVK
jgi:hypothetical protein